MKSASTFIFLLAGSVSALEIRIDYSYDTLGFFDQPGAKEAMRAVANHFEDLLADSLAPIIPSEPNNHWNPGFFHPATGAYTVPDELTDMVVPENTIIVFVGGRPMGGSALGIAGPGGYSANATSPWLDGLRYRGQAGAALTPPTDFGPWGGAISFSTSETWNFDIEGRPPNYQPDFVEVALHEMCHVLGFGTSDSFDARMTSGGVTPQFNGPASTAVWGGPVPLFSDGGHWREDGQCQGPLGFNPANPDNVLSLSLQSFGKPHGVDQIAIMDPSGCRISSATHIQVLTDLDLASLRDIGWEIVPPIRLLSAEPSPSGSSFTWATTSGISYSLLRSNDLDSWTPVDGPTPGDGTIRTFTESSLSMAQAYYQLSSSPLSASPSPQVQSVIPFETGMHSEISIPRASSGCGNCPCCD